MVTSRFSAPYLGSSRRLRHPSLGLAIAKSSRLSSSNDLQRVINAARTPEWSFGLDAQGQIMATRDSGEIGLPWVYWPRAPDEGCAYRSITRGRRLARGEVVGEISAILERWVVNCVRCWAISRSTHSSRNLSNRSSYSASRRGLEKGERLVDHLTVEHRFETVALSKSPWALGSSECAIFALERPVQMTPASTAIEATKNHKCLKLRSASVVVDGVPGSPPVSRCERAADCRAV